MFMFLPLLLGAVSTTGVATTGLATVTLTEAAIAGAAGAAIGYSMKNKVVINNNNGTMKSKTK